MYFAVVKISFEAATDPGFDRKALRSLSEKIRARFKVCAAAAGGDESSDTVLAIAALGSSEERLTNTLDAISEFCEASGFGRIASEQTLMDHIDALADFVSDEDD
ncbi:MAG: DUF503 family protein [Proteobacteria bacterium]|jgi:uncharacterized protein YlxP (DUF503 family)|nr:DUF503 family protein [Pseudomonadota bacterium]